MIISADYPPCTNSLRLSRPTSAPLLTAVKGTCGVHAPLLAAVQGTCGVPAPLLTAVQGTCGISAPLLTAVWSWRDGEEEREECINQRHLTVLVSVENSSAVSLHITHFPSRWRRVGAETNLWSQYTCCWSVFQAWEMILAEGQSQRHDSSGEIIRNIKEIQYYAMLRNKLTQGWDLPSYIII